MRVVEIDHLQGERNCRFRLPHFLCPSLFIENCRRDREDLIGFSSVRPFRNPVSH